MFIQGTMLRQPWIHTLSSVIDSRAPAIRGRKEDEMNIMCGSAVHEGSGFLFHLWCEVCEWERWTDFEREAREALEEHDHDRNDGKGAVGCGPWS